MSKKYTVGSLYAGVGGICLGFIRSGFEVLWANEIDKNACKTYRENFKHKLFEGDVMSLDIEKLKKVDVIVGGFPCQAFSVAGYRKGFKDPRGNHFFRMLDFVDEMRPKAILFENVKNLVGHDKGNTFKIIKKEILSRNYSFHAKILNTKDYGNIPHNRERIFIVAFNYDDYPNCDEMFSFPTKEILTKNILNVVSTKKVDEKFYYGKEKYMYDELKKSIKKTDTVYQWRRQYVRENKSKVCPTLTANMGTGGHNVPLIKTKYGIRKLTPKECFLFQGFPKDFKFPNISNGQLYKQAGNSVSVPVLQRISENIITVLNGSSCKQYEELF
ncbi:DNA (cytosine-5-)-methyltransferase [Flavobacteriaceae bacterium]|nr:DNA (cytosine-5-)-methyltransferase [Flavobacteriaceae bacterium]